MSLGPYYRIADRLLWEDGRMAIEIEEYRVVKKTPKGAWIKRMPFKVGDAVYGDRYGGKPRFVLDGAGRRFAYANLEDAIASYRRRKQVHVSRLETELIKARAAWGFVNRPDFKPNAVYQDDELRIFREY